MITGIRTISDNRILFFGTYDRTRVSRISVIYEGLLANGWDVRECNEPLMFDHNERIALLRRPSHAGRLILALISAWLRLIRRIRSLPPCGTIVVPYPAQIDILLARLCFPRQVLVLDQMVFLKDTILDRRGWRWMALVAGLFDRLAEFTADVVIVDTEEHIALVSESRKNRCVVVPVGAPSAWFDSGRPANPPGSARNNYTTVVFFGMFTPLQGTVTLAQALKLLHNRGVPIRTTLVGFGQDAGDVDALLGAFDTVRRVRWLNEDQLCSLVADHDICLGIFGTTPKALRVVPQKLVLGAACGCALITSDTEPQRRALLDAALYVPPGDPTSLADTLEELVSDPQRLTQLKAAALLRARTAFFPRATVHPLVHRLRNM